MPVASYRFKLAHLEGITDVAFGSFATKSAGFACQLMSASLRKRPDCCAHGIVEEIITALSRFSVLFVIARNSSFTYKGRSVDVKQVGRELGVLFLKGVSEEPGSAFASPASLSILTNDAHLMGGPF